MIKTNEVELKLKLPNVQVGDEIAKEELLLRNSEGDINTTLMEAIYLDTSEGNLNRAGFAYRIRKEGDLWIATVKTKGSSVDGLHERIEWNVEIKEPITTIDHFKGYTIYSELYKALQQKSIVPLFTTKFERRTIVLNINSSQIELSIDIGEIITENKREKIEEIELELKKGEVKDINELGKMLMEKYKLMPEDKSKFHRGMILMKS